MWWDGTHYYKMHHNRTLANFWSSSQWNAQQLTCNHSKNSICGPMARDIMQPPFIQSAAFDPPPILSPPHGTCRLYDCTHFLFISFRSGRAYVDNTFKAIAQIVYAFSHSAHILCIVLELLCAFEWVRIWAAVPLFLFVFCLFIVAFNFRAASFVQVGVWVRCLQCIVDCTTYDCRPHYYIFMLCIVYYCLFPHFSCPSFSSFHSVFAAHFTIIVVIVVDVVVVHIIGIAFFSFFFIFAK